MQFEEFKEAYEKLANDAPELQATEVDLAKMFLAHVAVEKHREEQLQREIRERGRDMRERSR